MSSSGGIHDGHRERQKNKFLKNGLDIFEQHEVLEMLLFFAIPRKDTNEIAHRLLERYRSFGNVCDAPIDELEQDFGLTHNAAVLLKMQPGLARLYVDSKNKNKIIDEETLGDSFRNKFIGRNNEAVALILGNARGKMIFFDIIAEGSLNKTDLPIRRIVDLAIRHKASSAYLAHNHPGGSLMPSRQDLDSTAVIASTLHNIGVMLLDHYIITDTGSMSIKNSGSGDYIFVY